MSVNKEPEEALTSLRSPIFVHSLPRSGSTYLFNVFRRSPGPYTCFQEAMHEIIIWGAKTPDALLQDEGSGAKQQLLRHPTMSLPYFFELHLLAESWRHSVTEEMIYDDYFAASQERALAYYESIIDSVPHRPVFQECRTSLRVSPLKTGLGGLHICLWRNPWDQWWSLKVNEYFEAAIQLFVGAKEPPTAIQLLRTAAHFPEGAPTGIDDALSFYSRRRPNAESSYLTFFTLWCLALDHGLQFADIDVNIDSLSSSEDYRAATLDKFVVSGVTGLDFSDAAVPLASFGDEDTDFFRPIEHTAFELLRQGGFTEDQLERIKKIRLDHAPANELGAAEHLALTRDLQRVRTVGRRIQTEGAAHLGEIADDLNRVRAEGKAAANAANDRYQVLLDQLNVLEDEHKLLQEQNGTLQEQNGTLQEQNGTLQEQNGTLQEQNGTLQEQNGTLQEQNGTLQEQVNDLYYQMDDAQKLLNASQEQINRDAVWKRFSLLNTLLRPNGRPKRPLRRALFHKSGKPRGMFKHYVLKPSGEPRELFRTWMESSEYLKLPRAHIPATSFHSHPHMLKRRAIQTPVSLPISTASEHQSKTKLSIEEVLRRVEVELKAARNGGHHEGH